MTLLNWVWIQNSMLPWPNTQIFSLNLRSSTFPPIKWTASNCYSIFYQFHRLSTYIDSSRQHHRLHCALKFSPIVPITVQTPLLALSLSHSLALPLTLAFTLKSMSRNTSWIFYREKKIAGTEEQTESEKEWHKTITNNEWRRKKKFVIGNQVIGNLHRTFCGNFGWVIRKRSPLGLWPLHQQKKKMQTRFEIEQV